MLQGKIYLKDLVDTKPIGVFLLYAIFQILTGASIWLLRLITALWVAATALGLFFLVHHWGAPRRASWAAALAYLLMTSIFTFYGVVPNTELYFNLFTVLALILVLRRRHAGYDLGAGWLLGLGFMIKYVILFDALAIACIVLWPARRFSLPVLILTLKRALLMGVAFILPFAATWFSYHRLGLSDAFTFYTFEVISRYPVDTPMLKQVIYVLDFFGRFLPVTFPALWALFSLKPGERGLQWFMVTWMIMILIAIVLPGKSFGHYFIQFMIPMALLFGLFFRDLTIWPGWIKRIPPRFGWALLVILLITTVYLQKRDFFDPVDQPREVAKYLESRLHPGEKFYAGNYHHLLYFLLDRESPTPYVHRSLLWSNHHRYALGINLENEIRRILEQKPRFVIVETKARYPEQLSPWLINYQPVDTLFEQVIIYELTP